MIVEATAAIPTTPACHSAAPDHRWVVRGLDAISCLLCDRRSSDCRCRSDAKELGCLGGVLGEVVVSVQQPSGHPSQPAAFSRGASVTRLPR